MPTQIPPCPTCGGPRETAERNRECAKCRSPRDTVGGLLIDLKTNPEAVTGRWPDWSKIRQWGRACFGQGLQDIEVLERIRDWFVAEHDGTGETFHRLKFVGLVDLLQIGNPETNVLRPKEEKTDTGRSSDSGEDDSFLVSYRDLCQIAGPRLRKNTVCDFLRRQGVTPYKKGPRGMHLFRYSDVVAVWSSGRMRESLPPDENDARQRLPKCPTRAVGR